MIDVRKLDRSPVV